MTISSKMICLLWTLVNKMVVFWNLIVIIPLLGHVSCLPYGAPNRPYVCQEMFPVGHGTDAQFSDPPFEITVLPNIYSQGQEEFRVTLKAIHDFTIKGFFIQARRAGGCGSPLQKRPVGVFQLDKGETYLKTMDCFDQLNSSVTHRISKPLTQAVFKWFAPNRPIGHIYLVATVVNTKDIFWTNVYSDIIRDISDASQPEVCPARVFLDPETRYTTRKPTTADAFKHSGSPDQRTYIHWLVLTLIAVALCNNCYSV